MDTNFSSDRVIVKLKPTANSSEITSLQAEIGVTQVTKASQLGIDIWQIPSGTVEKIISTYKNDPRFEYIEPDYIITLEDVEKPSSATESSEKITPQATTPNDPGYPQLWGLNNIGQSGGTADADIDAPEAWDIQKGNQNLVIGVIDTGVDYNHPDLSANIWTNPGEIAGDGIDNDSNGYIDDVRGWDFAYNDNNPMDVHGHGTHVAGTIAGKGNNGVGVTGVAWNAKIMPLKFLNDSGSGSTSNAILAINYATAKGVKLTNNSWGGGGYSQALYDAINTAGQQGALFIASAGNESNNNDANPAYPASYNLSNIISVASTTRTDGLSYFSNYGATTVDLGAPGSDIYSAWPNSSYNTISGTSMASPHVTGAAALLWSQNPTWTAQQVKNKLMQTTDPISALSGKTVTGGRLNINNALASSDTTPPTASSFSPTDNATGVAAGITGNSTWNFTTTSPSSGSFTEDTSISLPGVYGSSVAWADYSGDGKQDFLLTGWSSSGGISKLYKNTGSGFSEDTSVSLPGVYYGSVAWADYNGDGKQDFLLTGHSSSGGISKLYKNTGSGFSEDTTISLPGVYSGSVAWADYSGDGKQDFLLTGYSSSGNPISKLYKNTGSGFSEDTSVSLPGVFYSSVAWADYSGDGKQDFLLTGWSSSGSYISKLYKNTGSGFSEDTSVSLPGVSWGSVAWADYSGDGKQDFLLTGYLSSGSYISKLYKNTGSGFSEDTTVSLPGVESGSVAWADYSGDGKQDFLLTGYSNSGRISKLYKNTGSGFSEDTTVSLPGVSDGSVAWADYSGDGKQDFLLTGYTNSGSYISKLYKNTATPSDTTPPTASSFTPADNATGVAVAANLVVNFSEAIQSCR
ncbi:S8 family serine peptidase [Planktothrix agardhii]|uniref:S8 family serine peptidase n=1 Tax=Planktothrix agardhii TaxID=1160 RepID=UPI0039AEB13E|nr:S8 family serine peptidase [Planktothrix agardhii 1030]